MICNICNQREKTYHNGCKVCAYKNRNRDKVTTLLDGGMWAEPELDIVLDHLLYQKIEVINELERMLVGKSLNDIANLITMLHIGGKTPIQVRLSCFICGKPLIRTLKHFYSDRVYCSMECRDKYKTQYLSGKNSPFYNRIVLNCTNCGKEYDAIPYDANEINSLGEHNHFCCKECYWEFRSKHYIDDKHPLYGVQKSEESRARQRELTIKMIKEGIMPQTMTTPHKKIYELLVKNNIKCENEHSEKYHSVDIYLSEYNLMIEIMGDYWHGTPLKYSFEKLNKQQLKSVKQDKSKHTYIKKYRDVELLYLWENDINKNIDLCWKLIQEYIHNNGILFNYQSFNYFIQDDKLILKDEIITPYFITQNPDRLREVDGNTNLEVVSPTLLIEGDNIQSALTI